MGSLGRLISGAIPATRISVGRLTPNFGGYKFWPQKLKQFNGSFVNAELVRTFVESIKSGGRFGL